MRLSLFSGHKNLPQPVIPTSPTRVNIRAQFKAINSSMEPDRHRCTVNPTLTVHHWVKVHLLPRPLIPTMCTIKACTGQRRPVSRVWQHPSLILGPAIQSLIITTIIQTIWVDLLPGLAFNINSSNSRTIHLTTISSNRLCRRVATVP